MKKMKVKLEYLQKSQKMQLTENPSNDLHFMQVAGFELNFRLN